MKKNTTMKRFLSLVLVLSVLLGWALPANALNTKVSFRQVSNDSIYGDLFDRDPVEMQEDAKKYEDSDPVRVSIILQEPGTIEAGYDIDGIAGNRAAMNYRNELQYQQDAVVEDIEDATSEKLDVVWNLTLAANLISANTTYGKVEKIAKVKGVKAVIVEEPYNPAVVEVSDADPNMATSGIQTGAPITHAAGYTGAGSRIAIIDTGVDVAHLSFDSGAFDYSLALQAEAKNMSASEYIAGLDLLDAAEIAGVLQYLNVAERTNAGADDLYVNSKIPFGFNYVDEDLDITHLNDLEGEHGSHVAGIATANSYVPKGDGTYVDALSTVFAEGVAPDAQLIVMKVFGKGGGTYDSDYMAAIEDAIILGADSINLSLGSGNAGMSYSTTAAYQLIMDNLVNSGVVVCMSAGNNSYWAEQAENGLPYLYLDDVNMQTGGSPGSFTNSLGVASVDNTGFVAPTINVGNVKAAYTETDYYNAPISTIAGDVEYVFLNGIGEPAQFQALIDAGATLAGKLVLCYRGTTSFSEKANAAAAKGAKAVAIVNNQAGIINMDLSDYTYTVPVVSLLQADGEAFKTNGTPIYDSNNQLLGWTGSAKIDVQLSAHYYGDDYYTMSSFSSWGVPGDLSLKPEITAPGGQIHSVGGAYNDGSGYVYGDHASYEVMSGTSMASPQVAGMSALVAQYIREEGLEAKTGINVRALAQSLLMSTATPLLNGESGGNYYPVIQQGAGLANVSDAVSADSYLMMGADATDSYADGKIKVELGDDPNKVGEYTFTFYINNLTDEEKTYLLSADFFTQGAFNYANILFMDTWTRNLAPNISWKVDGKSVDSGADLVGMDFNGDGYINSNDGQAILDYAVGALAALENAALADIDNDNDVDSHDAYLFFQLLGENGAVVPANGSAEVQVTVTLTANDKAWLAYYENGAYLEGYVYAETMATDEGVAGTCHSIPVLGFYGNWSDASMYDKGSYVEYAHGEENRPPYLYGSNYQNDKYNGLTVSYQDEPGESYDFGGNPYILDEEYMPERNAINAVNGDKISALNFTLIRNAALTMLDIKDPISGGYYLRQVLASPGYAAFYNQSAGTWQNTYISEDLGLNLSSLPNNTPLEVGVTAVLEYYVSDDGSVDWDALGDGATFSMPMVIDNTAPEVEDVSLSITGNTMTVVVKDNQYIAAMALYDSLGQYQYLAVGSQDQGAGDTVTYTLDISQVNGASFLLQVHDYARNTTTYAINTQIGQVTDTIDSVDISDTSLVLIKGNSKSLSAMAMPVNATNRQITWSSSDDTIASVDANGVVLAKAAGTVDIIAASVADPTKKATCTVTVKEISVDLNGIVWDENSTIYYSSFNTNTLPAYQTLSQPMNERIAAACTGSNGTIYGAGYGGGLYTIDPNTYATTQIANSVVQGQSIMYTDLTYSPNALGTGALFASYGPYVIWIDPATGAATLIDQLEETIVGVAYLRDYVYGGTYLLTDLLFIRGDGVLEHKAYVSYQGQMMHFGNYTGMDTGISVGSAWYFNSAYSDGDYLYWAAFDMNTQDQVTLYAIDYFDTKEVFKLGQFPKDVWPVGGLHQKPSTPPAGNNSVDTSGLVVEFTGEVAQFDLNAAPGAEDVARPMSDAEVNEADAMITLKVTAGDLQAAATDRYNNGVISVDYDAEAMELKSIIVSGDYAASKKEDGKITFGYIDMDGVTPDTVVATLLFEAKSPDAKAAKITYLEANNNKPNSNEDVEMDYPHENTVIINAKEATATEPGYTGDVYCNDCKKIVAKGEEIPAKAPEGQGPPKMSDSRFLGLGMFLVITSAAAMAVLTVTRKKKYHA